MQENPKKACMTPREAYIGTSTSAVPHSISEGLSPGNPIIVSCPRSQRVTHNAILSVKVVRDEGVAIGRIVRKVDQDSDSEANVGHWIVSFVGDTEEHEVTEKYIGRLVESSETESVKSSQSPLPPRANGRSKTSISRSRKEKSPPVVAKSPPRSTLTGAKGEVRPSTRSTIKQPTKAPIKQGGNKKALLKGIKAAAKKGPARGAGGKLPGANETVVKVKMLTGTLYLYRGEHPRAEFIRTV